MIKLSEDSPKYDFRKNFQTSILYCVLKDYTFLKKYREVICPSYFNDECYQIICTLVLELYDRHQETPSIEVVDKAIGPNEAIRDTLSYILQSPCTSFKAIEQEAINFARSRALSNAIQLSEQLLLIGDYDKIKSLFDRAFYVGTNHDIGYNYLDNTEKRLESYDEKEPCIPTGLARIDNILEGGIHKKELGLFVAPPSGGKTTFLIQMGKEAVQKGFNVIHYSLELRKQRVARRYDMSISELTKQELYELKLSAAKKILSSLKGKIIIQEYPASTVTCDTIKNHLHRLIDQGIRIDLVIIDYDDLVNPTKDFTESIDNVKKLYREMRGITFEFDCALWTATQTNKKVFEMGANEVITGKEAAGSLEAKFGTPDIVITGNQTFEEYKTGVMRMHIAKNREGSARVTEPYQIDYSRMLIKEIP